MIAESIKLNNFRNYEAESLQFHPSINALVGLNGMGKTNVLDALYYLCLGKSYFSTGDKNVIMQEKEFFRLEGNFSKNNEKHLVVIKNKAGSRKEIEISGKKLEKISHHVGQFLCVIIAPDDIQMMLEGSEDRRNFINNTIVQTDKSYLEDVLMYGHLLKRRNALLKSFADQRRFDELLLESVSIGLYAPAQRIYEARMELLNRMQPIFQETYGEISGQKEDCTITYQSQLQSHSLETLMQQSKEKDRILTRTTQGIHKDDVIFAMNGEPLKNFASQGQLKSFVLALKIAQYKLLESYSGQKPILLLDDIFDKLDEERVRHLLTLLIDKSFGQVFITDTSQERIEKIMTEIGTDYKMFTVHQGSIQR